MNQEVLNSRAHYREPYATVYAGHALDILPLMPSDFVDCVITSPPYW